MSGRSPPRAVELGRLLLGGSYVLGACVHLLLWWRSPGVYADITPYLLLEPYRRAWTELVLPNLGVLLPLLAALEFLLAGLVLGSGRRVRIGNGVGVAFQVALAPLGFWWPANAVLAFAHAWLARHEFPRSALA